MNIRTKIYKYRILKYPHKLSSKHICHIYQSNFTQKRLWQAGK